MKRAITRSLCEWRDAEGRKPLILDGARQVGKTYALKFFGKTEFEAFHYINFEEDPHLVEIFAHELSPQKILQDLALYLKTSIQEHHLIVFDEVQACPRALTSLKYFCEDRPQQPVCAAGSLLGVTLSSEPFPVGKVDSLHMHPMSFEEFLWALGDEDFANRLCEHDFQTPLPEFLHHHLWQRFKMYLVVGGLPEVVALFCEDYEHIFESFEKVRRRQKDLINNYIRDVAKHSGKVNAMHVERIFENIPAQLARSLDGSVQKFAFKGVVPGIQRYSRLAGAIDWLVKAGLVIRVPILTSVHTPLKAHTKDNRFKLYVFDVGILGALGGLAPQSLWQYDFGCYKGFVVENYVAQELNVKPDFSFYGWQENTAEIEFLTDDHGEMLPIEVKSGQLKRSKSLSVFQKKYAPNKSLVLSGQRSLGRSLTKTQHLPLYAFHCSEIFTGN